MVLTKKGQGLSLTVIIVAAIALVVLVLLILIFTGRIAIFDKGLGESADHQLEAMKFQYGSCHPSVAEEIDFKSKYAGADKEDDEAGKQTAKGEFKDLIERCDKSSKEEDCTDTSCAWS